MAKDTYWFSHDSNARMDEKTLELRSIYGWEGYGIYWAIVETLREQDGYVFSLSKIGGLAVSIGKDKDWTEKFVRDCIDTFKLFVEDGEVFYSKSLKERMAAWDEKRESNRNAAVVRWERERNADAMHMHTDCIADVMPIREENRIEENTTEDIKTVRKRESPAKPKDLDEVVEYFQSIEVNRTEAESFFDYYAANGWKQGGGKPIKDWKAAARNWKRRMNEYGPKKQQNGKTNGRTYTPDPKENADLAAKYGITASDTGAGGIRPAITGKV